MECRSVFLFEQRDVSIGVSCNYFVEYEGRPAPAPYEEIGNGWHPVFAVGKVEGRYEDGQEDEEE